VVGVGSVDGVVSAAEVGAAVVASLAGGWLVACAVVVVRISVRDRTATTVGTCLAVDTVYAPPSTAATASTARAPSRMLRSRGATWTTLTGTRSCSGGTQWPPASWVHPGGAARGPEARWG
jgi:hypothetical protein